MSRLRQVLLTFFAAFALLFAGAAPALADHNAGADLDDGGSCYYGAFLPGSPPDDISTTNYKIIRSGESLLVVCYFQLARFIPVPEDCLGCGGEYKGDWTAPKRPVFAVAEGKCLPPGALSPGEEWPSGTGGPRMTDAKVVFYQTHGVMTCYWADDPTNDPGAPGGPALP
jgi:hypothetical protein